MSGERDRGPTAHRFPLTAYLVVALNACALTPLSNRIAVGEDPFVIALGEGPDGNTDLFAAPASGGKFTRLTFTRAEERGPRLSPDGASVAFLRSETGGGAAHWTLVALNLRTSVERTAPLGPGPSDSVRLGWNTEGTAVLLKAGSFFELDSQSGDGELRKVAEPQTARADSAIRERLGDPVMGVVVECAGGGTCIAALSGEITPLGAGVTGAVRWGADSVGYFVPGGFEVRPLAGGRPRRPDWSGAPQGLRSVTHHPGRQVTTSGGVSGTR